MTRVETTTTFTEASTSSRVGQTTFLSSATQSLKNWTILFTSGSFRRGQPRRQALPQDRQAAKIGWPIVCAIGRSYNRPGRTRTLNIRFWRPALYH